MKFYNYTFGCDDKFIGSMVLGSDWIAKEVANGCGANHFRNETENKTFKKCSVCREWCETSELKDGVCGFCGYLERLKEFITYCESELDKNYEDKTELYKEDFILSFKDQTLKLPFGAIEYNALVDCLKDILKENQE